MDGALMRHVNWPGFSFSKSIPVVWQAEAGECGLACLSMCLSQFDCHLSLRQLRQRFSSVGRGTNIQQLKGIAQQLGLRASVGRVALDDLARTRRAMILHWDFNHFVVLIKKSFGRYLIHDPAQGRYWLSQTELSNHYTGIAMLVEAATLQPVAKEEPISLLAMINTTPALLQIGMTLLLSILLQACMIVSPLYLQTVIDDVLLRFDDVLLASLALGFGLLLLFQTLSQFVRDKIVMRFAAILNQQMSEDLFKHLLNLPLKFFNARHVGDIQSRFNSLDYFRQVLSQSLAVSLVDGLLALATLIAMYLYNPLMTAWVVMMMVLYMIAVIVISAFIRDAQQRHIQKRALLDSQFIESIKAILTLKQNRWIPWRISCWGDAVIDSIHADLKAKSWQLYLDTLLRFLQGLEHIVLVYLAAQQVMQANLTVGALFAFMAYKGRFSNSLQALVGVLIELRMLPLHRDRISDILLHPADKDTPCHSVRQNECDLAIENICFDLPKGPSLAINFSVAQGECLAIVGESGCGKSTLLRCILGLTEHFGLCHWRVQRNEIAAVLQEDVLLSGTLQENITGFGTSLNHACLQQAIGISGLDNVLQQLPMGLDTAIGEQGTPLSAGQTQRILLARALYRQPKILILDEATSHLDVASEKRVMAALRKLPISIVMVAHRTDCLAFADRFFDMQRGVELMHLE